MSLLSNFIHYCDNDANYFIPESQRPILLEHFRSNYYANATFERHSLYLRFLYAYRVLYERFPTVNEFYGHFRPICMCIYSLLTTRSYYILAAEFFMRELGHLNIDCSLFYYHLEFHSSYHRHPNDMHELEEYVLRVEREEELTFMSMIFGNFDSLPLDNNHNNHNEKVAQLPIVDMEESGVICGICHEEILKDTQKALKLEKCNHYYHSQSECCCETGTIFKWLERNDKCPLCRTKI